MAELGPKRVESPSELPAEIATFKQRWARLSKAQILGLPGGASGKELVCPCRRHKRCGFHPWVRKSLWRRKCNPLQYSCLGNPMNRGAWQATVHGVAKSQTQLERARKKSCTQESHPTEAWHASVAGRERGRRKSTSQSQESPWDGRPGKGPWLPAGRNARASGSGGKADLSRETHPPQTGCRPFQKARGPTEWGGQCLWAA